MSELTDHKYTKVCEVTANTYDDVFLSDSGSAPLRSPILKTKVPSDTCQRFWHDSTLVNTAKVLR